MIRVWDNLTEEEVTLARRDPREPDYTREGVFIYHNCYRCKNGTLPCRSGSPNRCDNLTARND